MVDIILAKDITGYISTTLLALLYIPQTFWVFYKKDPHGLTWPFLLIGLLLTADTIAYGAFLGETPLILANIIAMVCILLMIIAKCIWKNNKGSNEEKSNIVV